MAKFLVSSDLHVDTHLNDGAPLLEAWKNEKVDAIILAGDIGEYRDEKTINFIKELCKTQLCIITNGNHSFWKSSPQQVEQIIDKLEKEVGANLIHLKYGKVVKINEFKIIGDTLWYPRPSDFALTKEFPDYRTIKHFVPWVYQEHEKTVKFLEETVDSNTIVVTHHVPTNKAITEEYVGNPWNHFFIYDMDKLIKEKQPRLWLCGHTHTPHDITIGNTRVYCNPRGYFGERNLNPDFLKRALINI